MKKQHQENQETKKQAKTIWNRYLSLHINSPATNVKTNQEQIGEKKTSAETNTTAESMTANTCARNHKSVEKEQQR